jgi:hypothetical protein
MALRFSDNEVCAAFMNRGSDTMPQVGTSIG